MWQVPFQSIQEPIYGPVVEGPCLLVQNVGDESRVCISPMR
jgi:hypothetical protein